MFLQLHPQGRESLSQGFRLSAGVPGLRLGDGPSTAEGGCLWMSHGCLSLSILHWKPLCLLLYLLLPSRPVPSFPYYTEFCKGSLQVQLFARLGDPFSIFASSNSELAMDERLRLRAGFYSHGFISWFCHFALSLDLSWSSVSSSFFFF